MKRIMRSTTNTERTHFKAILNNPPAKWSEELETNPIKVEAHMN